MCKLLTGRAKQLFATCRFIKSEYVWPTCSPVRRHRYLISAGAYWKPSFKILQWKLRFVDALALTSIFPVNIIFMHRSWYRFALMEGRILYIVFFFSNLWSSLRVCPGIEVKIGSKLILVYGKGKRNIIKISELIWFFIKVAGSIPQFAIRGTIFGWWALMISCGLQVQGVLLLYIF